MPRFTLAEGGGEHRVFGERLAFMDILKQLGFGRSTPRPVGDQLERGRPEGESDRRNLLVKLGIFAALLLITVLAFPRGETYQYTVQVGDTWRRQTLVAPFDFAIYKDPETLAAERRAARENTPPYFREVPNAQAQLSANRNVLAEQLDELFTLYASYRRHLQQGEPLEATADSLRYVELRREARGLTLTAGQWRALAQSYLARQPDLRPPGLPAATGPRLDERLLRQAWQLGMLYLELGVLDVPLDSVHTEEIIVRNEEERVDRVVLVENVFGLDEAYAAARSRFEQMYTEQPERADLAQAFFRAIFEPSLEYMLAETLQEQERRMEGIAPTRDVVQEGEIVVSENERITAEIKRKLVSLERAMSERAGRSIVWKQVAGEFMLSLVTYFIFFSYLFFLRRRTFRDNRTIFLIALLFAGVIVLYAAVVRVPAIGLYAVPVAVASVQLTILFDSRVGLFGTLTLALIGGLLSGFNFEYAFATLFAGTLGVFSVRDIKNRGQYFLSGGLVFVGYAVGLFAGWLIFGTPTNRFLTDLGFVAANSLLVVMAYPLLWVFERGFDVTTDLTLLELSDTNRKLLKELSLRAPGSFNHTLQVANLAEAAADAIGANTLLARVGALYHDVGKMLKPEYYVENQRSGENPHDRLKPRMSALIIASHVKEGLELGRQHNLPRRVLNFIPMHHGTTRIEYFYRKSLQEHTEGEPAVLESEFRYPGPRPDSRETGILMLADGVEAASRSIEEPTHKRLEQLIDAIFKARIEDGQLDDTNLTFRDLNRIKQTFLSMLMGIYHVRVKYPNQAEEETSVGDSVAAAEDEEHAASSHSEKDRSDLTSHGVLGTPEQSVDTAETDEAADGAAGEAPDSEVSQNGILDLDPERRKQEE